MTNTYDQLDIVKNRQQILEFKLRIPPLLLHTFTHILSHVDDCDLEHIFLICVTEIGLTLWPCEQCRHTGPGDQHLQFNTLIGVVLKFIIILQQIFEFVFTE